MPPEPSNEGLNANIQSLRREFGDHAERTKQDFSDVKKSLEDIRKDMKSHTTQIGALEGDVKVLKSQVSTRTWLGSIVALLIGAFEFVVRGGTSPKP